MPFKDMFKKRKIANVAAAEEVLLDHARESESAAAALANLTSRRRDLLLADASDAEIEKLDLEADRLRIKIEKLELMQPILMQELQDARGDARRTQWRALQERHHAAALAYGEALRAACDALKALIDIREEAVIARFERECGATFAIPPRIIDRDQAEKFLFETERLNDAELARREGRTPQPQRKLPTPSVDPRQQASVAAATPPAKREAPPAPRAPYVPIREAAGQGEVLVIVIRSGVQINERIRATGDVVSVSPSVAESLVRNGAVEFENTSGPQPEATL